MVSDLSSQHPLIYMALVLQLYYTACSKAKVYGRYNIFLELFFLGGDTFLRLWDSVLPTYIITHTPYVLCT